jgi:hypothetical protein
MPFGSRAKDKFSAASGAQQLGSADAKKKRFWFNTPGSPEAAHEAGVRDRRRAKEEKAKERAADLLTAEQIKRGSDPVTKLRLSAKR